MRTARTRSERLTQREDAGPENGQSKLNGGADGRAKGVAATATLPIVAGDGEKVCRTRS